MQQNVPMQNMQGIPLQGIQAMQGMGMQGLQQNKFLPIQPNNQQQLLAQQKGNNQTFSLKGFKKKNRSCLLFKPHSKISIDCFRSTNCQRQWNIESICSQ